MKFIRPLSLVAAATLALVPHVVGAQFGAPTTLAGTIVLADSDPGTLKIDCAKVIVTATSSMIGMPPRSGLATAVETEPRTCNWQITNVSRGMQLTIATNVFPIADTVTPGATPVSVNATVKAVHLATSPLANPGPIALVVVPSAAFPTPPPAPPAGVLTITAGGTQTRTYDPRLFMGATNDFLNLLAVRLTTEAGVPIAGAPIVFSCPPQANVSNCSLQQDFSTGVTKNVTVTTDKNGMATLSSVRGVSVAVLYAYTSALPDGSMPPMPITATYKNVTATFFMKLVKS